LSAPIDAATIPAHVRRYASFLPAEAIARIFGISQYRTSRRFGTSPSRRTPAVK
jgi:hypothetical protein